MNRDAELLLRLLGSSWAYPSEFKEFRAWCSLNKETIAENASNGKEETEDDWDETFEDFIEDSDNKTTLLLCFLLDKNLINSHTIKTLYGGFKFGNSCYGDWRKEVSEKFGADFR